MRTSGALAVRSTAARTAVRSKPASLWKASLAVEIGLRVVLRERVARGLPIAHLGGARVDLAGQAAAMAGVGDKQHLRALELELLDEMIELRSKDALLRAGRSLRIEAGQNEYVVHAVRLRSLEVLGFLRRRGRRSTRSRDRRPGCGPATRRRERITVARSAAASNSAVTSATPLRRNVDSMSRASATAPLSGGSN